MSVSIIDALLQIAVPTRPVEPPTRGESGRAFGPALERAYGAEQPATAVAPPRTEDESAEAEALELPETRNAPDESASGGPSETEEIVEPGAPVDEEDAVDKDEAASDAVEISEQAAAAPQPAAASDAELELAPSRRAGTARDGEAAKAASTADNENSREGEERPAAAGEAILNPKASSSAEGGFGEVGPPANDNAEAKEVRTSGTESDAPDKRQVSRKAPKANAPSDAAADSGPRQPGEGQRLERATAESAPVVGGDTTPSGEPVIEENKQEMAEAREPRPTKDDRSETPKSPAIQDAAKAPVLAEGHAAWLDAAASSETPPADGASRPVEPAAGTAAARSVATLDRLAARSMRTTDETRKADDGLPIDRPRFLQRVEGAVRAAQQRDGRVQVRLSPPELGNLRIELVVQNGVMTARLEAETPAARNALLDNLPALRERLAQQDIRVEKFDVDLRRDTGGGAGNGGPHDRNADQPNSGRQEGRGKPVTTPRPVAAARGARAAAVSTVTDAGLDVRI